MSGADANETTKSVTTPSPTVPGPVLEAFGLRGRSTPIGGGLINATFGVDDGEQRWIVQRVNPIFAPENHLNIAAVTEHLQRVGLATPHLRPTNSGALFVQHDDATWRAMNRVEGHAFDTASSPTQLLAAARFVARWHDACASLEHTFVSTRVGVHDTPAHLDTLRATLANDDLRSHPLYDQVVPTAEALLRAAEELPALPSLSLTVAHGDLKLNNLIFSDAGPDARPRALIDLDTVAPMQLAHEMGDALRSWCNRAEESSAEPQLDAALAAEISNAYLEARGMHGDPEAHAALVHGPEWISLELASRFFTDALRESYFGWDPKRYASRGAHNLDRARGQWALHRAFVASRRRRDTAT